MYFVAVFRVWNHEVSSLIVVQPSIVPPRTSVLLFFVSTTAEFGSNASTISNVTAGYSGSGTGFEFALRNVTYYDHRRISAVLPPIFAFGDALRFYVTINGVSIPVATSLSVEAVGYSHKVVGGGANSGVSSAAYGAGFLDGVAQDAAFNAPKGIAFASDYQSLLIADTGNSALRRVSNAGNIFIFLCISPLLAYFVSYALLLLNMSVVYCVLKVW